MVLVLMIVMIISLSTAECRQPVLHRVGGGKYSWAPNINLTQWASHEQFYVGDWLYFGFNKSRYNVLEVNKMNYDKCIDKNFIMNITKGGRDVFNLTEAKPYYFLSSRGYCFKGLKLAVEVQYAPPDHPQHFMFTNASPSLTYGLITLLPAVFSYAVLWKYLPLFK